jgi:CHAD domain-containing protein
MLRHLTRVIEARAAVLTGQWPAALRGDVEAAHRVRVAARRLGEVLPLFEGRRAERVRADVRHVRQALGARREWDVTMALLRAEAARWSWAPALVARVDRALTAQRPDIDAEAARVVRSIDIARVRRRLARVAAEAHEAAYPDVLARLRQRRSARERALARAVAHAGALYDVERLHAVRIAVKKLRYVLEAQRECTGRGPRARVKQLKALQAALGRLHDLQVLEAVLRAVEESLVAGRGSVARGVAAMGQDIETECRRLHAHILHSLKLGS